MALSAAEKQRRYRQRRDQDPERRREYLLKQKQKYQDDIKTGKRKKIGDLSERAKRGLRKKWRIEKKHLRSKKQTDPQIYTPPCSPGSNIQDISGPSQKPIKPNQKIEKDKRKIAKCYRELTAKKAKIKELEKKVERYRLRWRRLRKSNQTEEDTPNKASEKTLRKSKKTVRKVLVFHHTLLSQMKSDLKKQKANKRVITGVLAGNIMRKYKIKTWAFRELGLDCRRTRSRKLTGTLSERLRKSVVTFLERDDNSRLTTGIKSTITRKKIKKQKRLLLDTLMNTHKKYLSEQSSNLNISYSVFCRLRPFWVVVPTEKDRDTCLCKLCENSKYLAEAMLKYKLTTTSTLELLCANIVCSTDCKECMYRTCRLCKNKEISVCSSNDEELSWFQWKTVKEQRVFKSGVKKGITIVKKQKETGNAAYLGRMMNIHLKALTKHMFNIKNQFRYYKNLKEQLLDNECLIHIDFAENYVGKMANEIQSVHFGASRPQMTLHTGAYYVAGKDQEKNVTSFCSLSDCLEHGPSAVWTYLNPVLLDIKQKHPQISFIHFFSDGPVTQYKQKKNFYLLSTEIFCMGYTGASWNFHEAGHGKGVPDAIGGSLKRSADLLVRHGKDIMNAAQFKAEIEKSGTNVQLYVIDAQSVFDAEDQLAHKTKQLKAVPNTMALHQIQTVHPCTVMYRNVSCVCKLKHECKGHEFTSFSFPLSNVQPTKIPKVSTRQTIENAPINKRKKHQEKKLKKKPCHQPLKSTTDTEEVSQDIYEKYLLELQGCKSFSQFKRKCQNICLSDMKGLRRNIVESRLTVDQIALDIYPNDVPESQVLFPVIVQADGDCLPASGSVFAFGSSEKVNEMRLRIAMELALHEECYLDNNYLSKGIKNNSDLRKAFAMYSEGFIPGVVLTDNVIKTIYENEVRKIVKPKTFMGIWQLFALSSVLKMPIYSVYPRLGNRLVRESLHRRIEPRVKATGDIAVIMWSSTRSDMVQQHWVPNHFLPVLPIDCVHSVEQCQYSELETTGDVETVVQVTPVVETAIDVEEVGEVTGVVETVVVDTGIIVETLSEATSVIETVGDDTSVAEIVGKGTGVVEVVGEGTYVLETVGEKTGVVQTVGKGICVVETFNGDRSVAETIGKVTDVEDTVVKEPGVVKAVDEGTGIIKLVNEATGVVETVGDHEGQGIVEAFNEDNCVVEAVGDHEGQGISETFNEDNCVVEAVDQGTDIVDTVGKGPGVFEAVDELTAVAESINKGTCALETCFEDSHVVEGEAPCMVETFNEDRSVAETVGKSISVGDTLRRGQGVSETVGEGPGVAEIAGEEPGVAEISGEEPDVAETIDDTGVVETVCDDTSVVETVDKGTCVMESNDEDTGVLEMVCESRGVVEIVNDCTYVIETVGEATGIDETVDKGTGVAEEASKRIVFKSIWEKIAIGKYVVVTYDSEVYPGIVMKISETRKEVFVECMKKESGLNGNMFSWPKKKKDRCWYPIDAVKAIIPPPKTSGSLFHITSWEIFNSE